MWFRMSPGWYLKNLLLTVALTTARNIIRDYSDEIATFAEEHLLRREIMVRREIL